MSHRIAVMYLGRIVELAAADELLRAAAASVHEGVDVGGPVGADRGRRRVVSQGSRPIRPLHRPAVRFTLDARWPSRCVRAARHR